MKQISLLCYVLMASLCLGLISCGKDDYEDEQLIGYWQAKYLTGYEYDEDGDRKDIDENLINDGVFLNFKANNSGEIYNFAYHINGDMTWNLNGKKKRLTIVDKEGESVTYSVDISGNTLILEVKDRDDYGEYYLKYTFVKDSTGL